MLRLEDVSATIRGGFPPELADTAAGVTALGDPAVLTLLLALLYWLHRREATARVVGYAFFAFSLTLLLKYGLAMPRPPESVRLIETSGYGFPSGHAIAGVVVYGGLALEFEWLDEPPKALAMSIVALSVGFSRIVLGVHYLGDVLVGFAVGAAVLAVGYSLFRERPEIGYVLGAALAIPAIVVSDASPDAFALLGYSLGGVVGLRTLMPAMESRRTVEAGLIAVVGVAFVVGMVVVESAIAGVPAAFVLHGAILVGGVMSLPAVVSRVGVGDVVAARSE